MKVLYPQVFWNRMQPLRLFRRPMYSENHIIQTMHSEDIFLMFYMKNYSIAESIVLHSVFLRVDLLTHCSWCNHLLGVLWGRLLPKNVKSCKQIVTKPVTQHGKWQAWELFTPRWYVRNWRLPASAGWLTAPDAPQNGTQEEPVCWALSPLPARYCCTPQLRAASGC